VNEIRENVILAPLTTLELAAQRDGLSRREAKRKSLTPLDGRVSGCASFRAGGGSNLLISDAGLPVGVASSSAWRRSH